MKIRTKWNPIGRFLNIFVYVKNGYDHYVFYPQKLQIGKLAKYREKIIRKGRRL